MEYMQFLKSIRTFQETMIIDTSTLLSAIYFYPIILLKQYFFDYFEFF